MENSESEVQEGDLEEQEWQYDNLQQFDENKCFFCSDEIGDDFIKTIGKALFNKYCQSQSQKQEDLIEKLVQEAYCEERVQLEEIDIWEDETEFLHRVYQADQFPAKIKRISAFYAREKLFPRILALPECDPYIDRIQDIRKYEYRRAKQAPDSYSDDEYSEVANRTLYNCSSILKHLGNTFHRQREEQWLKEETEKARPRSRLPSKSSAIKSKYSTRPQPRQQHTLQLSQSQALINIYDKLKTIAKKSRRNEPPVQFSILDQSKHYEAKRLLERRLVSTDREYMRLQLQEKLKLLKGKNETRAADFKRKRHQVVDSSRPKTPIKFTSDKKKEENSNSKKTLLKNNQSQRKSDSKLRTTSKSPGRQQESNHKSISTNINIQIGNALILTSKGKPPLVDKFQLLKSLDKQLRVGSDVAILPIKLERANSYKRKIMPQKKSQPKLVHHKDSHSTERTLKKPVLSLSRGRLQSQKETIAPEGEFSDSKFAVAKKSTYASKPGLRMIEVAQGRNNSHSSLKQQSERKTLQIIRAYVPSEFKKKLGL